MLVLGLVPMAAGIGIVCMAAVSEMAHEKVTKEKKEEIGAAHISTQGGTDTGREGRKSKVEGWEERSEGEE